MAVPSKIREAVEQMPTWEIAEGSGCAVPDSSTSPGADFLDTVRVCTLDAIADVNDDDLLTLGEALDDRFHEIADGSVDVGTYARWISFVDLMGWQEEIADLGEIDGDDLTNDVAGRALYVIGERAARWIVDYVADEIGTAVDAALEAATDLGADHGRDAAAWWTQENVGGRVTGDASPVARRVLAGLDDGDPEILDGMPNADLSGTWADGITVADLLGDDLAGIDVGCEIAREIGDNYVNAFADAAHAAIADACRAVIDVG